ncbi:MAG: hypothetical protein ACTSO9_07810 [Candidatus Helarchaeota archaeon]
MNDFDWDCPRDGDIILTDNNFIFYVMGYDHPKDRVISYLKYIPNNLKKFFKLDWIPHKWQFSGREYVRPKMLYSPNNFKSIEATFKTKFPDYLYFSQNLGKSVFAIPKQKIKRIFVPKNGLKRLIEAERKDFLQTQAIKLVNLLSNNSKISLSNFGIHGSLLTSMHSNTSDIDIAVYGAKNFLAVKNAVSRLEKKGQIQYLFEILTDKIRKNKGLFENKKFVFNAIRKISEVKNTYDFFEYKPIKHIKFECKIVDGTQAVFRPAMYEIADYKALNNESKLDEGKKPKKVISMIGEFRDIVHKGELAEVKGMLERVKNKKTGKVDYRVVIGSGFGKEFILPVDIS